MGKSRRRTNSRKKTKTKPVTISEKPQSVFQSFTKKQKALLKSVGLFKDIPRDITLSELNNLTKNLTKVREKEIASDIYAAKEYGTKPIYTRKNKEDLEKINALNNILRTSGKIKKGKRKKQTKRKK